MSSSVQSKLAFHAGINLNTDSGSVTGGKQVSRNWRSFSSFPFQSFPHAAHQASGWCGLPRLLRVHDAADPVRRLPVRHARIPLPAETEAAPTGCTESEHRPWDCQRLIICSYRNGWVSSPWWWDLTHFHVWTYCNFYLEKCYFFLLNSDFSVVIY